jgi:hypothetical protein
MDDDVGRDDGRDAGGSKELDVFSMAPSRLFVFLDFKHHKLRERLLQVLAVFSLFFRAALKATWL